MMTKTNSRGKVTAIYLHGVWFFPKPMTKKRKKSVCKMPEIKAEINFFNFEQVYAFQESLPKNIAVKDEFELMIEEYVKKFHATPCRWCRGSPPNHECEHDYQQEKCEKFKRLIKEMKRSDSDEFD